MAIRQERDRAVQDLERRNLEEQAATAKAKQLAQVRARVLAMASHDLRQPLHALSIYSTILAANPAAETLPEVAHNIDRLVRILGGMLHGLLDLSRLSAESYAPERQLLSLQRVVGYVCKEYAIHAAEKQLCLTCDFSAVRLYSDPLAIARIARNLLDNAIKYTDQGEVKVSVYIEEGMAVLSVADTGRGIPFEEQDSVFNEFYQLQNAGRNRNKGVGLGLTIVQRLCELIGACITVESQLGVGSQFKVRFNSMASEAFTSSATVSPVALQQFHGKRVYVVDNEFDILESTQLLLRTWGVYVETAITPESAEALFVQYGNPDLLIIDLWLNGQENGVVLANRLQNLFGDFAVLIMTGETASAELHETYGQGYPLFYKPISSEVLFEAVSKVLDL